jgi:hypothetical protein
MANSRIEENKEFYQKHKGMKIRRNQIISKTTGESYESWNSRRGNNEYFYINGFDTLGLMVGHVQSFNCYGNNLFNASDISLKDNNLDW